MTRVQVDIPDGCLTFRTPMTVRTSDLNYANHLGNDAVVSLLSEARARFFDHLGTGERPPADDGRPLLTMVTDLALRYLAEGHRWDALEVAAGLADPNRYGGDIYFRMSRPADGVVLAEAKIGFVCVDPAAGKVAPMPTALRALFPAD